MNVTFFSISHAVKNVAQTSIVVAETVPIKEEL